MPLYEYRCLKCGHQFDVTHAVSGSAPRCEKCGAVVRRVFSPIGIIFKGAGFHVNDYRKTPVPVEGESKKTSSEKNDSTSSSASSDKSTTASSTGNGAKSGKASKAASKSGGGGATH